MDHGGFVVVGQVLRQPLDEPVHRRDLALFRHHVLLRPAAHLAREIAARPAEIRQARRLRVDSVQDRQAFVHLRIDPRALAGVGARHRHRVEDPPALALHDVERRADDRIVLAQEVHLRQRQAGAGQRLLHPVFALDRVGRRQQRAGGLLAQDVFVGAEIEREGGVRLASLELPHAHRRPGAVQLAAQPGGQRALVEPVRLAHGDRLLDGARAVVHGGDTSAPPPRRTIDGRPQGRMIDSRPQGRTGRGRTRGVTSSAPRAPVRRRRGGRADARTTPPAPAGRAGRRPVRTSAGRRRRAECRPS